MPNPDISLEDLISAVRRQRDHELGPNAVPHFRLSDVKRRQRRAAPFSLTVLAIWVVSILAVIAFVRPLMVARSVWYGLLIILYLFASIALMGYCWTRVQRAIGLYCPYCRATFMHTDLKNPRQDPVEAAEHDRRCSRCQAVIIDLET